MKYSLSNIVSDGQKHNRNSDHDAEISTGFNCTQDAMQTHGIPDKPVFGFKSYSRCPKIGLTIRTKGGQIIKDPFCFSPRCPRCCKFSKFKVFKMSLANLDVNCKSSYFVLPYMAHVDSTTKGKINQSFFRKVKRKFQTEVEYICSLEMQNNLYHANFYVLHDTDFDYSIIKQLWAASIAKYVNKNVKEKEMYAGSVIDQQKVINYITKLNEDDPSSYLPPKQLAKHVLYTSKKYKEFVNSRMIKDKENVVENVGKSEKIEYVRSDKPDLPLFENENSKVIKSDTVPLSRLPKWQRQAAEMAFLQVYAGTVVYADTS